MLTKDNIVKYASRTEDVADRVRLGCHILDVYYLGGHIAWGSAPDKEIVRVIRYGG
jgi:hypothetical protein